MREYLSEPREGTSLAFEHMRTGVSPPSAGEAKRRASESLDKDMIDTTTSEWYND